MRYRPTRSRRVRAYVHQPGEFAALAELVRILLTRGAV